MKPQNRNITSKYYDKKAVDLMKKIIIEKLTNTKDLDGEFVDIVNENFWDLV